MLSTQPDPLPLPCYTLYKYIPLYLFTTGKGGGGEKTVRRLEGRRRVENNNMPDRISSL